MSKSRMVTTRFWSDNFIVDNLNPLDRYLFLYLLTNEKTNIIGIYELPLRTAAFETGIEIDNLKAMISRLSPKIEYIDGWIYVQKFVDHQSSSPKVDIGMEREVISLPITVRKAVLDKGFTSDRLAGIFHRVSDGIDKVSYDSDTQPHLTKLNLTKLNITKPSDKAASAAKSAEKKVMAKPGEIDKCFEHWKERFGTVMVNTRNNRDYASRLIRDYGIENTFRYIDGAALAAEDRYAPSIANFSDLYRKIDKLTLWGKKRLSGGGDRPKVVKV